MTENNQTTVPQRLRAMADEGDLCPACGRDRANREPHKPGCLPPGMTAAEVLSIFKPLPQGEADALREVGTR